MGFDRLLNSNSTFNNSMLVSRQLNKYISSVPTQFNFSNAALPYGNGYLDANGDADTKYSVLNARAANSGYTLVGYIEPRTGTVDIFKQVVYAGNSTNLILDNIDLATILITIKYSSPVGLIFLLFNVLAMVSVLYCSFFYFLNESNTYIRATSVPLSQMILLGLLIQSLNIFTMTGSLSNVQCISDIWTLGIGCVLVMGTITIKLMRLHRIFSALNHTEIRFVSDFDCVAQSIMLLVIELIYLTIWTAVDPPIPKLFRVSSKEIYYSCTSKSQTIWISIFIFLNGSLLVAASTFAYLTRKIASHFNETKMVAASVYNQVIFVGAALAIFLSQSNTLPLIIVFSIKQSAILICIWSTLTLLFFTKIYYVNHKVIYNLTSRK